MTGQQTVTADHGAAAPDQLLRWPDSPAGYEGGLVRLPDGSWIDPAEVWGAIVVPPRTVLWRAISAHEAESETRIPAGVTVYISPGQGEQRGSKTRSLLVDAGPALVDAQVLADWVIAVASRARWIAAQRRLDRERPGTPDTEPGA